MLCTSGFVMTSCFHSMGQRARIKHNVSSEVCLVVVQVKHQDNYCVWSGSSECVSGGEARYL